MRTCSVLTRCGIAAACSAEPVLSVSPEASSCGSCHTAHYESWAASTHATSGGSPVFQALVGEVGEAWGATAAQACVDCHQPGHAGDASIGCMACHGAVGNRAERDGQLIVDLGVPLSGPFVDPEPNDAHISRSGSLLRSPVLCGTCHEVTGPRLFRERTLTEYRSGAAVELGLVCADCHMPSLGTGPAAEGGRTDRRITDHRFVGMDPPWGAPPEEAAAAAERAHALLASALVLHASPIDFGFVVTVSSVCPGHRVPTGVAMLRDLRVVVSVTSADGEVLATDETVLELFDQPMSGELPVPLVTRADHVVHRSLESGESRSETVTVPPGAARPVTLVATVRARAYREDVLAALGLSHLGPQVPVHEVLRVEATLD